MRAPATLAAVEVEDVNSPSSNEPRTTSGPTTRPGRRTRATPSRRGRTRSRGSRRRARGRRSSPRRRTWPCAAATSKCSTRSRRPWTTESYSQGSPAHQMPGAEVSSVCEHFDAAALAQLEPGAAREHARRASRRRRSRRGRRRASCPTPSPPRSTRFSPSKRATPSPVTNSIPWRAEQLGEEARSPALPKPVDSGPSSSITSVHCLPEHGQRRGDLAGDVGAADQHDLLGVRGVLAERHRGAERAQVVDAVVVAALDAQPVDVGAGGEQRAVEAARLPCARARPSSPPGRASSRSCGCAARCRAPRTSRPGAGARRRARTRRAVGPSSTAGARRAGAARGRRAAPSRSKPALAQRLGAGRAGQAAAHDQDVDVALSHRLPSPSPRTAR